MQTVGVRELANRASALLDHLQGGDADGPYVVTKHGRPVAVLSAIDAEAFHDFVLTQAPEYIADRVEADRELAEQGRGRGRPVDEVFADIDPDLTP